MSGERARAAREAYETWHPRVESGAAAAAPWHALLLRHLRETDVAGRSVLEIGCGRGELACALAARPLPPRRLVAADFAVAAVGLGRARARSVSSGALRWVVSDIQQIAAFRESFDTVISCETLEHVLDPASALRELHRVLKPGGRLLLTTPSYLGTFGLYRGYLRLRGRRYTEGEQPISRFMLWPVTAMRIRHAGFRVLSIDATGHYALRPGRPPAEPFWVRRVERWLWPFGLHSIIVAEKRAARDGRVEP